jgi:hypothetical protein
MGNLLPFLIASPFAIYGIMRALSAKNWFALEAIASFFAALFVAYIAVNFLGLASNRKMRMELFRRYAKIEDSDLGWFVGIATPGYISVWDPHEDIGFMKLAAEHLVFQGDSKKLEIPRNSIRRITKKANPHSYLLLGGWIAIDGILDHKPIRLLIEPREKDNMLGNKRKAKQTLKEIQAWAFKK